MTPFTSPGRSTAGRTCRPGWSAAVTTACSRWSSSVAWPVNAFGLDLVALIAGRPPGALSTPVDLADRLEAYAR